MHGQYAVSKNSLTENICVHFSFIKTTNEPFEETVDTEFRYRKDCFQIKKNLSMQTRNSACWESHIGLE